MKLFLTGANGLVGRNFINYLNGKDLKNIELVSPSSKELDLRKFKDTKDFIKTINPKFIIHCAGVVGGIQANLNQPRKFLLDNLDIGKNIVYAAYECGVKNLINLGSSCMYPKNNTKPIKESQILTGEFESSNEGYALAKVVVYKLCKYIHESNNEFKYKTLIPCNIYGPYDKFLPPSSHLIPAIIHKIHNAKKNNLNNVSIWGDGKAKREFMYSEDLARFIFKAFLEFEKIPFTLNIGMGKDYTINDYYKITSEILGYEGEFINDISKPTGMLRKIVCNKEMIKLNWHPKYDLQEGIKKTYDYYLKVFNK